MTCFRWKNRGHPKRECTNKPSEGNVNPFGRDYYQNAIQYRNQHNSPRLANSQNLPIEG
ncbi:putative transcription factor interactor and regulator CCHC(Zn) family [Helianthus anomalus]